MELLGVLGDQFEDAGRVGNCFRTSMSPKTSPRYIIYEGQEDFDKPSVQNRTPSPKTIPGGRIHVGSDTQFSVSHGGQPCELL